MLPPSIKPAITKKNREKKTSIPLFQRLNFFAPKIIYVILHYPKKEKDNNTTAL